MDEQRVREEIVEIATRCYDRGLLVAGWGVSVMDESSAGEAVRSGALVRVLPQWSLPKGGLYAVVPPGRHTPAKARAFIEFYRGWLADQA